MSEGDEKQEFVVAFNTHSGGHDHRSPKFSPCRRKLSDERKRLEFGKVHSADTVSPEHRMRERPRRSAPIPSSGSFAPQPRASGRHLAGGGRCRCGARLAPDNYRVHDKGSHHAPARIRPLSSGISAHTAPASNNSAPQAAAGTVLNPGDPARREQDRLVSSGARRTTLPRASPLAMLTSRQGNGAPVSL